MSLTQASKERTMNDFLSQVQSDELVNGQTYNGEYVPTDQDMADMNEAWDLDNLDFNEALGYDIGETFFCANCGHVELVTSTQSPDSSLCCDCYKWNNDHNDYYEETESDTYQDAFYDQDPYDFD